MKRFIAIQLGARLNYAIPAILAQAHMLEALYTDMCADAGLGQALTRFVPSYWRTNRLARLLNRRVPSVVANKVHTFDSPTIRYQFRLLRAGSDTIKRYKALSQANREFGEAMVAKGVGQATHLFSMFGEGGEFLSYAKRRGLTVITDVYISPLTYEIVQRERKKFKDLEPIISPHIVNAGNEWVDQMCKFTDMFVAPSQFVVDGLETFGVNRERCRLIPYAVGDFWFHLSTSPDPGRILFVGTAEVRKGIHILGLTAEYLRHRQYRFRIAGGVSKTIRHHRLTKRLEFLGHVPRTDVYREYQKADVFVMPTLAEGSALVVYEALAVGLPVVTTEAAGSVVRDGIEGFIVPSGDSDALAARIEQVIEDRSLRDRMSIAAKARAQEFTWEKYSGRLLRALQST